MTLPESIDEREYARLLGYPWGKRLDGDVLERAQQASAWYRRHASPRVYCTPLPEGRGTMVVAVTAGFEAEREVDRLWERGCVDEAYFLDRYGAAVVEMLAARLGPCRSPGTAGIPFEEQPTLFAHLAPLRPEIEILPSGMLKPRNSLLAVVSPESQSPAADGPCSEVNPCRQCRLARCAFRRRG